MTTMNLTQDGYAVLLNAVTTTVRGLHLFTDKGELEGYGYEPKPVDPGQWTGNRYPTQEWVFSTGPQLRVRGYYVTGADGKVLWSREFPVSERAPDDYVIGRDRDRIAVTLTFGLLAGNQ